jgi:asparagine synthase (glutamine-hydrolysing)
MAAAAGRLRRRGAATAGLLTYSFAFDDTPECDERDVSHLVAEGCGLINHPVPTANGWPLSADVRYGPVMDGPYRFRSHPLLDRSMALARADGATTLMLGQRGDALVGEDVVDYAGLLAAGRVRQAWTELAAHGRLTGASRPGLVVRYLLRQIAAVVWPPHVAPLARGRLRGAADGSYVNFPRWLRPDAVARFGLRELAAAGIPRSPLRGEARRTRHRHILDAHNERNAEALELRLARDGLRYVDPWSDRRLAEFVLGLPQYAITPAGQAKGLLRDALRGIIPEPARVQARKRSPQAFYVRGLLGPSRPAVLGLMTGSRAAARGFVDETKIREIYLGLSAPGGRMAGREWGFLWRFLETENWLRQFHDR